MAPSRRLLVTLMTVAVGCLAVQMLKCVHTGFQDIPAILEEQNSKMEVYHNDETKIMPADDENKTSVSVYHCLQLKTELDPFNLLMALNQSTYSVADFTTLDIEEIRQCLNFLEIFQRQVSQKEVMVFGFDFLHFMQAETNSRSMNETCS
jgi:hypothetical protein